MNISRRTFVAAAASTTLLPTMGVLGANDDIHVAIIGVRSKGKQHIDNFGKLPGVRIVAVCDPDAKILADRAKLAEKYNHNKPVKAVADMRDIFDDPNIDAVVVATPNHWHALATIWGCESGKDVYCEKPVSHNLFESQQQIKAARKYDRIVQAGTQRRSDMNLHRAFARVQSGEFGKMLHARVLHVRYRDSIGKVSGPQAIPSEVDYNLWAGPAPMSPITRKEFHYDWHWFWETGNGELGNNGPHHLDMARWALNEPQLAPAVMSIGGRYGWNDNGETPNTHILYYDYKPAPIIFEIRNLGREANTKVLDVFRGQRAGLIIQCEGGYFAGMNGGAFYDNDGKRIESVSGDAGEGHPENFIKAVRSRKRSDLNCDIAVGHASCGLCHQGNISHHLGKGLTPGEISESLQSNPIFEETYDRMASHLQANNVNLNVDKLTAGPMLQFDQDAEKFTGHHSKKANTYLRRSYRKPFEVKEI